MDNKFSKKFYTRCYRIFGPLILLFRPISVAGRENIPAGAALVCANHSAMIDPLLIALSFDINTQLHVMAKIELYKVPVISWLIRKLGTIPVDRSTADINSVKVSMHYLKAGEKILIFPEGTRLSEYDSQAAKNGAIKLAERTGVPVLPVYLPRSKPYFRKCNIIIGKPYYIEKTCRKRTAVDYTVLSKELMDTIESLTPEAKV